jgi:hypothetical protein
MLRFYRSFLHVDGMQVVNNDGLHGDREICGAIKLSAGDHTVVVSTSTVLCAHYKLPKTALVCIPRRLCTIFFLITGNHAHAQEQPQTAKFKSALRHT